MHPSETPLTALPADASPDRGPAHRAGLFAWFIALTFILVTISLTLIFVAHGYQVWKIIGLVVSGAIAVRAIWCIAERFRHRTPLPASHDVLRQALGFEIHCTCRDVAATVFFTPDSLPAGAATHLLCFVENYASRARIAVLHLGPHRQLGLDRMKVVQLHLAAGQAAVYALPLSLDPALPPGEHDLPVTLRAVKPHGTGARLSGPSHRLYDLWTVRFAAPFTVTARSADAAPLVATQPAESSYITLASVSEAAPQLDRLEKLIAGFPQNS